MLEAVQKLLQMPTWAFICIIFSFIFSPFGIIYVGEKLLKKFRKK